MQRGQPGRSHRGLSVGSRGLAAAGTSHHQVRLGDDKTRPNPLTGHEAAKHRHGLQTHLVGRQCDCSERRVEECGDVEVAKANERNILRDAQASPSGKILADEEISDLIALMMTQCRRPRIAAEDSPVAEPPGRPRPALCRRPRRQGATPGARRAGNGPLPLRLSDEGNGDLHPFGLNGELGSLPRRSVLGKPPGPLLVYGRIVARIPK